jgi:chaperonin cofactor prefoldin
MNQHPDTVRLQHLDLRVKQLEAKVRRLEEENFDLKSKLAAANPVTFTGAAKSN